MSDKPLSDFQVGDRVRITTVYNDSPFDVIAPGLEMTILSVRHGGSVLLDRDHSTYSVDGRLYRAELISSDDPIAKLIEYVETQRAAAERSMTTAKNESYRSYFDGVYQTCGSVLSHLEAIAAGVRT